MESGTSSTWCLQNATEENNCNSTHDPPSCFFQVDPGKKKTFRILEVNGWPFLERLLPKVGKTISGFDRWMVSLPHSQWDVPGVPFIFTTITAMVKPLPPLDEILVFYRKSPLAKPPAGTRNRRVTCMLLVASSSSSVGENSSNKASLGIWWLLGLWFTLVGAKCHFQDP